MPKGIKGFQKGKKHPMYGKHHSQQTKEKISKTLKGQLPWNTGKKLGKNPKHSEFMKELFRNGRVPWNKGKKGVQKISNETKKKMSLARKKEWELEIRKGSPCSEEHKKKTSVALKGNPKIMGKNNHWYGKGPMKGKHHSRETKEKLRQIKLKNPTRYWLDQHRSAKTIRKMLCFRSPNKAEQKLNRILKTNFPHEWKFVGNGKVIIERKNPDFININGKKLIIELFGEYWHDPKEVEPRKSLFAKYGYQTLIIWSKELENEENVIKAIRSLLGKEK